MKIIEIMKNFKNKMSNGLMYKFLVPFSIVMIILVIVVYMTLLPQYIKTFYTEEELKMADIETEIKSWLLLLKSDIDTISYYLEDETDDVKMLNLFRKLAQSSTSYADVYFVNTVPVKDGGKMILLLDIPADYDQTTRDWYQAAIKTRDIIITEPYTDVSTDQIVYTFAKSIYKNNVLIGVLGLDFFFNDVNQIMNKRAKQKDSIFNLVDENGIFVTHSDNRLILKKSMYDNPDFLEKKQLIKQTKSLKWLTKDKAYLVNKIDGTPWTLIDESNQQSLRDKKAKLLTLLAIVFLALIGVETVLVIIIVKPLSFTLDQAISIISAMADGNFGERFSTNVLKKDDQTGTLAKAIDKMQKTIGSIIYKLRQGVDGINHATNVISEGTIHLSERSNSQASSLEELAGSIEEVSASLKATAKHSSSARDMSIQTSVSTKNGVEAVSATANNMQDIANSSKKILDITKIIESIAFQTNILALNAAVEAARAGDQGRGFAVVASEVRSLAQTVADAAKDIGNIINDTVNKIELGTASVAESSAILSEIEKSVLNVSGILIEISNAVIQEEDSISQINVAVLELNNITQENSNLAENSAEASKDVFDKMTDIANDISYFKFKNMK